MTNLRRWFDQIWVVDFEFHSGASRAEAPVPLTMVAKELLSGRIVRLWLDGVPIACPFEFNDRVLYVAYMASAEIGCHLALGWPIPTRIADMYVEFRWMVNGHHRVMSDDVKARLKKNSQYSQLAVMAYFGIPGVESDYKSGMQNLAIRAGPFTNEERRELLSYNESDVIGLEKIFYRMLPHIEWNGCLFRGRYMANVAQIERHGVPVDGEMSARLKSHWDDVVDRLIYAERDTLDVIGHRDIDQEKFEVWLQQNGFDSWPRTPFGRFDTSSNTLSDLAKYNQRVMRLKEFVAAVRRTKLFAELQIGSDNRNRFLTNVFASKTGRNQPSNATSIFGPATYVRSLIRPAPDHSLIYCDFEGQEYAEAAYFSGDPLMIADYETHDPYLGFAKRIGLVPPPATKKSHKAIRDQLKIAAGLGVLYGAHHETVARAGDMTFAQAHRVLTEHRHTYPTFWRWRAAVINHANMHMELTTPLGWRWNCSDPDKSTSISNFMMQASGSDMLRVAACLAVEDGLEVAGMVHDALLIHCPTELVDVTTARTVEIMEEAGRVILGAHTRLRVGVDSITTWPDRYADPRGVETWAKILGLLEEVENPTSPPMGAQAQLAPHGGPGQLTPHG